MRFHIKSSSYHHCACTMLSMPTMLVLCLLCLYYAYYVCTMPTMPVLCLLCLYYAYYACYVCTMPTMFIYNYRSAMPPSHERGRVTTITTTYKKNACFIQWILLHTETGLFFKKQQPSRYYCFRESHQMGLCI